MKTSRNPDVLLYLFKLTLHKYRKLSHRLNRNIQSGRFKHLSSHKQRGVLHKVERLRLRLKQLSLQLKFGLAAGAVSLFLNTAELKAQTLGPFVTQVRTKNPVRPPILGMDMYPTSADVDNDNDIDILVGSASGGLRFFRNDGTPTKPAFNEINNSSSPFFGLVIPGSNTSPAFTDIDGDGDKDLFVCNNLGDIFYFKNTGGVFTAAPAENPFAGFSDFADGKIAFADIDGDNDTDLVAGMSDDESAENHSVVMLENNGSGIFTRNNRFDFITTNNLHPAFADVDGNGDIDLFLGNESPTGFTFVEYYAQNEGNFIQGLGPWDGSSSGNPMDGFSFASYAAPHFVDLDNDGDLDAIVGRNYKYSNFASKYANSLAFLENTASTDPELEEKFLLEERSELENPFDGILAGRPGRGYLDAVPVFLDADKDGDLDMALGAKYETPLNYYEFDNQKETFIQKTGTANPVAAFSNNQETIPRTIDFDYDGDFDLLVGAYSSNQSGYLKNENGVFELTTNPLVSATIGLVDSPCYTLIDVDSDGDDDAIVGTRSSGGLRFYRKVGATFVNETATAPTPFNTIAFNQQTWPTTADINNDGKIDIVIGIQDGTIRTFLNSGANSFTELTGTNNIFTGDVGTDAIPTLIDYDADGDNDIFVGRGDDKIDFVKNENPAPVVSSTATTVNFTPGIEVVIDANMNFSDADGDIIRRVLISINSYEPDDEFLSFTGTLPPSITAFFDDGEGALILSGDAPASDYQTALRQVTYRYQPGSGGGGGFRRKESSNGRTISSRTIIIGGYDIDSTNPSFATFTLTHPNVLPNVVASVTTANYTSSPFTVDNAISVTDDDDFILSSAKISITAGLQTGEDALVFANQNGITGSYDASTGILTLTGVAPFSFYQTALRSIQYSNALATPTGISRTITFTINDGETDSPPEDVIIAINVSNQPPALTNTAPAPSYVSGVVAIADQISITDSDNVTLQNATVSISTNFQTSEDVLVFVNQNGITGSFNSTTGTLQLTGAASVANYQAALRSVQYQNTNTGNRNKASRTINFVVNDGVSNSNSLPTTITLPNQAPAITNTSPTPSYVSGTLVIADQLAITDGDNATLQSAAVALTTNFQTSEDVLLFINQNGISGSFNSITGVLILTGASSKANYQAALRTVQYQNTNPGDRNKSARTITFSVNDGVAASNIINAAINLPNQLPAVSLSVNPPLYGSGTVAIADQLTLNDADNATLQSATFSITSGLAPAEDQLLFTNQNGIAGTYTASTGILQLTGSASKANYQTAIRSVQYQNNSATPSETARVISIVISDGVGVSTAATLTLNINRPPVITPEQDETGAGEEVTINVLSLISDPDNNIDVSNITIVSQPQSGALASIVNGVLTIDYSKVASFTGTDHLTISACDNLGRCTTEEITIEVGAELEVFNAISPNGDEKNDFLLLRYINPENKVTIYNRWGDKVFEIVNYNNTDKRFIGLNDNGNELPTGTYFYKIEYRNTIAATGYLSLKR